MNDLLDLMVSEPKPTWRGGISLPHGRASLPSQGGDLSWFAHDWRDHRKGGRWYWYDAAWSIWCCIDPFDQTEINTDSASPPLIDQHGRLQ